ncbi:GspE/PulE family protein [Cognatiyoonia sp. IB215446]|uniref:GspE/PulE family protein n=1 Tax=Cognatiyoonia sp. IB215446 TaxID=3097355 RepID=UPI002A0F400A|nr:GspE/PulE family protein [Cognatiyoonia sp. IB215446]MDX8349121.1 GspE/PulE family protein [Cognatiyoonia sp. IB215446]
MLVDINAPDRLPNVLVENGRLSKADLAKVTEAATATGQPVRAVLDRLGLISQKEWARSCAEHLGLPLVSIDDIPERLPEDPRLSSDYLIRNAIAPIEIAADRAYFAVADPFDPDATAALEMIFGSSLALAVATDRDIELAMTRSQEAAAAGADTIDIVTARQGGIDLDTDKLTELANNAPTVRYLDTLFDQAVEMRATDIHLEPTAKLARVRLRVDGELVEVQAPDKSIYEGVISRLKILAGMDISERRLPQDGRIRQRLAGRDIDMRVASAPMIHGETIVLRLLDNHEGLSQLADLALPAHVSKRINAAISQPNGLILVTGPTGSGKTTTLHAAMNALNETRRKIVTIENPVEIQTPGLQQIEVNAELGWTFAAALRTVLRHDPDVIMVGEIRDSETAELAVRAAMTGHLVFSTLHTNTAHDAATRLVDLGVPEYLIRSVVRLVAAQRLVRRVCPVCAQPVDLSKRPKVKDLFTKLDRRTGGQTDPSNWTLKKSVGCDACNQTGFQGRIALFEAMEPDEVFTTKESARAQQLQTMGSEAVRLVAEGETTMEEVMRILGVKYF